MPSQPDPIGDAIAALTAAARGTRTIGAGTPHAHTAPVDFGEIARHVLTAVAANVGGVEGLLAGRPGSWEADYVRQIVHSTAGDRPEDLAPWQTEPDGAPHGMAGGDSRNQSWHPGATDRAPEVGPTW